MARRREGNCPRCPATPLVVSVHEPERAEIFGWGKRQVRAQRKAVRSMKFDQQLGARRVFESCLRAQERLLDHQTSRSWHQNAGSWNPLRPGHWCPNEDADQEPANATT